MILAHILMHPHLLLALAQTHTFKEDPVLSQLVPLFHNYTLVCLMYACLALPHLPTEISEAFDAVLSTAQSTIIVLLVDRGFDQGVEELPRAKLSLVLCTALLALSK